MRGAATRSAPIRKLLVVEDELGLRRAVARYFERHGLEVTEAGTLCEAHDRLDAADFDAVVLDVGLPDGDGLTLLERTDARRSVVVTANPDLGAAHFARCGVIHHLAKPLDLRELRAEVEEACSSPRG